MNDLRSFLYRMASLLGWVNAASKGPGALVRRVVRVQAYKGSSSLINRLTRPSRKRSKRNNYD